MTERALAVKVPETKGVNSLPQTRKTGCSQSIGSHADQILFLQRTIGNKAVQRLMKSGALQAKLRLGAPGDKYEQEANRVAGKMVGIPEARKGTAISKKISDTPSQCRHPKRIDRRLSEGILRPKEVPGLIPEITPGLEANVNAIRGGGQPMPEPVRTSFEPRFGFDFSKVRIHFDAKAAEAARVTNARAFTVGYDVYFGEGNYEPGTVSGLRLLAHELTHVVQQSKEPLETVQRQPENPAIEPPPNGITIDVLDPLNSSVRIGGFRLPSPRNTMNVLTELRRLGQLPPSSLPGLLQPEPSEGEMRAAACRALPSICREGPVPLPSLPPLQLSQPKFHPPRIIFYDSLVIDHFIFNSDAIPDRHRGALDLKAIEMIDHPSIVTDLAGHTDSVGSSGYNLALSERRAKAVRNYLLERQVPAGQIWNLVGLGKAHLKFPNDTADPLAASRNRRVEMEMHRLVWDWTLSPDLILQPPRLGGLSVIDPRQRILENDRPQYERLRTFLIRAREEINVSLGAGAVGQHKLTRENENVVAMLNLLDELIASLQSERYVVRFDQPLNSRVAASYTEQDNTIHLRPSGNDQSLTEVAINLLHEFAHAVQDRTAEQLLRAGRQPLEHGREDELRNEIEARRHEVYFANLLISLGYRLGAAGFEAEVSARVFAGRFERERTGTPAQQAEAREQIRSQIEPAYEAQLTAYTPSRKYLIDIRNLRAVLIGVKGIEIDLGPIPGTIRTIEQLNDHLAERISSSPAFPGLFQGAGATKLTLVQFIVFEGNYKVGDFALTPPVSQR